MNYLLCPQCGYPNKQESKVCGFCQENLGKAEASRLRPPNSHRQAHRKKGVSKKVFSSLSSRVLKGILGGSLFSIGGYMFYLSAITSNFKLWLISLLFILYGFQALRPFLKGH